MGGRHNAGLSAPIWGDMACQLIRDCLLHRFLWQVSQHSYGKTTGFDAASVDIQQNLNVHVASAGKDTGNLELTALEGRCFSNSLDGPESSVHAGRPAMVVP
jgi:hypothetical protein